MDDVVVVVVWIFFVICIVYGCWYVGFWGLIGW